MVEMAMVLPIFLAITLGIMEFGRALMVGQLVTNAAREGARLAVLDGTTNTQVIDACKSFMQTTANVSPAVVTVTVSVDNAAAGGSLAKAQSRDLVTVTVSVPFSQVSYLTGSYLTSSNLVGRSAMRHE